jgi:hypothetical protein
MTAPSTTSHGVTRVHVVDGHEWRVVRRGTGSRVVPLLPGRAGQAETEFPVVRALEPHVHVLTATYPPLRSMSALTDGIVAVLDAEGVESVDVWGNSFRRHGGAGPRPRRTSAGTEPGAGADSCPRPGPAAAGGGPALVRAGGIAGLLVPLPLLAAAAIDLAVGPNLRQFGFPGRRRWPRRRPAPAPWR